jgi:hypothetical protein
MESPCSKHSHIPVNKPAASPAVEATAAAARQIAVTAAAKAQPPKATVAEAAVCTPPSAVIAASPAKTYSCTNHKDQWLLQGYAGSGPGLSLPPLVQLQQGPQLLPNQTGIGGVKSTAGETAAARGGTSAGAVSGKGNRRQRRKALLAQKLLSAMP